MAIHELPTERDLRGAGCGEHCQLIRALLPGQFGRSELLLHDPAAHEEYGRRDADPRRFVDVLATGPLTVDFRACQVWVNGRLIMLTATEYKILQTLARSAGRMLLHDDVMLAVWAMDWACGPSVWHLLRVNVARLRAKLGEAANLIATVTGFGYRLDLIDVGAPAPARRPWTNPRLALTTWATHYDRCRSCGRDDRPHKGHGYCLICYERSARRGALMTGRHS